MKLIHTADWHIGQSFFGYDRREEHSFFFDWLKETIKEQQVDVLLVAGDVFDSPNPSAESQRQYYKFLKEVSVANPQLQVVITAGNHDSAARLEAPNPLLEEMNVRVRGVVKKDKEGNVDAKQLFIPLLEKGKTKAWCVAVPYLRQGDYPLAETYAQGVKALYDTLYAELQKEKEPGEPVVVMGHLHALGAEVSENDRSERVVVGGLECVSSQTFDQEDIVYTALGHLHKAQKVAGRETVRYSGSPLPMSFAEKNYKQGVNLVEIIGKEAKVERLPFQPLAGLISLPKEPKLLPEVLDEIRLLPDGGVRADSPYLELKVLVTEPEPSMRSRIEEALEGKAVRLTSALSFRMKTEAELKTISYEELKAVSPAELAENVFLNRYGKAMPEKMKSLLYQVIEEVMK